MSARRASRSASSRARCGAGPSPAARGSNERIYPWGDAPPSTCLVNDRGPTIVRTWPLAPGQSAHFLGASSRTAQVNSFYAGASPFGVINLAGNVAEWTADVVGVEGAPEESYALVRGGSYADCNPERFRASSMGRYPLGAHVPAVGFRCVRDPR